MFRSVTAAQFQGYTASYSSGCVGNLVPGAQNTCVITETPNNFLYNPYPQYTQPYYNQPYPYIISGAPVVTVTPSFVPRLPNTGFEPQNGASMAFALVALLAAAFVSYPYVRKAFATLVG